MLKRTCPSCGGRASRRVSNSTIAKDLEDALAHLTNVFKQEVIPGTIDVEEQRMWARGRLNGAVQLAISDLRGVCLACRVKSTWGQAK